MAEGAPILAYAPQRICGRVIVSGSGDQTRIVVRPNWRLAALLYLLAIACAAGGWCMQLAQKYTDAGAVLGLFLGYVAAIILFANAVGQTFRTQRVEMSAKRLTVFSRSREMPFLRDEIVSIITAEERTPMGYDVPSVTLLFRDGAEMSILRANRKETAFAAEVLCGAMGLAPDPLHRELFKRVSGRYVTARVTACGVIADLRRRPHAIESLIISLLAIALAAAAAVWLDAPTAPLIPPIIILSLGYHAFLRFSPFICGGIWDGDVVFAERRWLHGETRLQYERHEVTDVGLVAAPASGQSFLRIVLQSGEEVLSERSWRTDRLQTLVDTINEARRICA